MDLKVPLSEVRLDKNFEERDPQNFDFLSFDIIIERCHQNMQSGQHSNRHGHLFSRLACGEQRRHFSSLRRWFYNVYVASFMMYVASFMMLISH